MIKFNVGDGKQIQIERDGIEARAQEAVLDQIEKMRVEKQGMYRALKMAIETILVMNKLDIPIPDGVNKMDFLACYFMKFAIDLLEQGEPITVAAQVVDTNVPNQS